MTAIERSTVVSARPDRVFEVMTDLPNASDRISGIVSLEVLTEGPIGEGTRFRETRRMFGKEATEEMEITEFVPGKHYELGCTSCGCFYKSVIAVAPEGNGSRLTISMTTTPLTFVAKVMGAVMTPLMRKLMYKCFDQDLADIKAAAEAA